MKFKDYFEGEKKFNDELSISDRALVKFVNDEWDTVYTTNGLNLHCEASSTLGEYEVIKIERNKHANYDKDEYEIVIMLGGKASDLLLIRFNQLTYNYFKEFFTWKH